MTFLLGVLGPKLFGVLLEKGMQAFQQFLARKDLKDSVRKSGEIAALKMANLALEWKSRNIVPDDVVRDDAPPAGTVHPPDAGADG